MVSLWHPIESDMNTDLSGRLRNTTLAASKGLMPLFEAVVNSIHAIEDAHPCPDGTIVIKILRASQMSILDNDHVGDIGDLLPIDGFRITDNGIGFNEENMKSFRTLDSLRKAVIGGRGVGRLLWLKAFKKVLIESTFNDESGSIRRLFEFNDKGICNEQDDQKERTGRLTKVHLDGFKAKYSKGTPKSIDSIADALLEHCLWYFVREEGAPSITICDGSEDVSLNDMYRSRMVATIRTDIEDIKGYTFTLKHIRLSSASQPHSYLLCAASRVVKPESIQGKIPGLFGKLSDGETEFEYQCYVTSPWLDDVVRSERTDFDIQEDVGGLFVDQQISYSEIRKVVLKQAEDYLKPYLQNNIKRSRERIETFVSDKAPRYRPLMRRMTDDQLGIDPNIQDKTLELYLHEQFYKLEQELLQKGHDLLKPKVADSIPSYKQRIDEYIQLAIDVKQSDLAGYVSHRRVIIDLLGKALEMRQDGTFAREEVLHTLIMPMGVDSNDTMPKDSNLWLIDERLAFHNYLASDKRIAVMPITGCDDLKEPDIIALNVFDNPLLVSESRRLPLASIVVVEFKRPMRNDASVGGEKDPIVQSLDYLERIRQGKVSTVQGRQIPNSEQIPGFCYVVCDLTPSVQKMCRMHDATPTSDMSGYFYYHREFRCLR